VNQKEQIKVFLDLYDVSRETMEKLSIYEKLIIEGQKKFNLIGKSTLGSIWLRHFADSAKLLKILKEVYQNSEGKVLNLLDVGSGAGFPGVVLSIMTNAEKIPIKVALADSNRKKSLFLKSIKKELGVSYTVVNKRSENINQKFEIITARAVTSVKTFLDLNHNLIKKESILVLFKGRTWKEEVKESKKKWKFELNVVKNNIRIDSSGGVTLVIRNLKK
jgi:16S rRNA (guanine527-N7)-methyltransferase|tara:strand:- start:167 stop:823 length:657 start_codon:yes stop_codon:yes gene_type:complete